MPGYTPFEMIAFTGSRVLEDEKIVFVGTGLPIIASMHAQLTHAPNLSMIFESGPLSPVLDMGMPLSVGDTRACRKACYLKGLCAVFELTQRGYSDYAFIGGAQIDMYGNVCSTFEGGTYNTPPKPGSPVAAVRGPWRRTVKNLLLSWPWKKEGLPIRSNFSRASVSATVPRIIGKRRASWAPVLIA